MKFPNNAIKGIPNQKDFITEDGKVTSHIFQFRENPKKNNNLLESSINWQDDEFAIEFTKNQKKEDESFQFKYGVAIISRFEIDRINKLPMIDNKLFYERDIQENNKYHGNILIQNSLSKATIKMLSATLALHISEIIKF